MAERPQRPDYTQFISEQLQYLLASRISVSADLMQTFLKTHERKVLDIENINHLLSKYELEEIIPKLEASPRLSEAEYEASYEAYCSKDHTTEFRQWQQLRMKYKESMINLKKELKIIKVLCRNDIYRLFKFMASDLYHYNVPDEIVNLFIGLDEYQLGALEDVKIPLPLKVLNYLHRSSRRVIDAIVNKFSPHLFTFEDCLTIHKSDILRKCFPDFVFEFSNGEDRKSGDSYYFVSVRTVEEIVESGSIQRFDNFRWMKEHPEYRNIEENNEYWIDHFIPHQSNRSHILRISPEFLVEIAKRKLFKSWTDLFIFFSESRYFETLKRYVDYLESLDQDTKTEIEYDPESFKSIDVNDDILCTWVTAYKNAFDALKQRVPKPTLYDICMTLYSLTKEEIDNPKTTFSLPAETPL